MSDLLCPFSAPLIKKDFACPYAQEIIRRGGAEIACESQSAHSRCSELHNAMKTAALQAMELEDDLLSLAHSILVKIQYGGLLGLKNLTEGSAPKDDQIVNVVALVSVAMEKFNGIDDIPMASITKIIMEYKVKRRRK